MKNIFGVALLNGHIFPFLCVTRNLFSYSETRCGHLQDRSTKCKIVPGGVALPQETHSYMILEDTYISAIYIDRQTPPRHWQTGT